MSLDRHSLRLMITWTISPNASQTDGAGSPAHSNNSNTRTSISPRTGGNERAHDLVDLQILEQEETIDLAAVGATATRLFAARRTHSWPAIRCSPPALGIHLRRSLRRPRRHPQRPRRRQLDQRFHQPSSKRLTASQSRRRTTQPTGITRRATSRLPRPPYCWQDSALPPRPGTYSVRPSCRR
jgi:hypothetical protein